MIYTNSGQPLSGPQTPENQKKYEKSAETSKKTKYNE